MIEQALQSFGLNSKEIKVYLSVLELGMARVSEIAKKSGIERTHCYSILEKLMALGLVLEIGAGKRKQFAAEPPEKIEMILKERQNKIKEILPELKSIYNLSPKKPKIRFYEGKDGIILILEEMIETLKPGEFHYHCGPDDEKLNQVLGVKTVDDLIQKRIKKGIKSKIITDKTPHTLKLDRQRLKGLRQTKFLAKQKIPSRLHIFGPKIALMSLNEPIMTVVIEDKAIADLMRMFFEGMWKNL